MADGRAGALTSRRCITSVRIADGTRGLRRRLECLALIGRRWGGLWRRFVSVDAARVEDPVADALLLGHPVDGRLDSVLGQGPQDAVLLLRTAVHAPHRVVGRRRRVPVATDAQPRRRTPARQPLVVRVFEQFCR